ncbi:MAG: ADP-ribosylglycohydrolase family protein [Acidobacteria bacterium]|nr:ADP-ribosylglycohydrolase family protein [Acidobacteriota bacterium]
MAGEDLASIVDEAARAGGAGGAGGASSVDRVDRGRGVMLGLAVGNALGVQAEFWDADEIAAAHPNGLREIDPAEHLHPWDDDLAQAALLAEAMLAGDGRMNCEDLARRLTAWFDGNGRGIGNLTYRIVESWKRGVPAADAARRAWEETHPRAAGNGAVMRCAPVAVRWQRQGAVLVEESARSCLVTHFDPRCVMSSVALNVAIAAALGGATVDLERLARAIPEETHDEGQTADAIRAAAGETLEAMQLDREPGSGYTLLAMKVGLWAATRATDLEESLVRVVSLGGDTDTNGAVAGAALGARFGARAIPARWIERLRDPQRLIELADGLTAPS